MKTRLVLSPRKSPTMISDLLLTTIERYIQKNKVFLLSVINDKRYRQ